MQEKQPRRSGCACPDGELRSAASRGADDPCTARTCDAGRGIRAPAIDHENRCVGFRASSQSQAEARSGIERRDDDCQALFQDFLTLCSR